MCGWPCSGASLWPIFRTKSSVLRKAMRLIPRSKKWWALLVVLGMAAGVAWWQRTPLLTWYYLQRLTAAAETDRAYWAKRVAGLDEAALPGLFDCLQHTEARVCDNAQAALLALV